ncbi:MAG: hypothetical protein WD770_02070 [Actinomycetota bacterium]
MGLIPSDVGLPSQMKVQEGWLFLIGDSGLAIYGVKAPRAPQLVSRLVLGYRPIPQAVQLAPDGEVLVLKEADGGPVHIYDSTDKANVVEVSRIAIGDLYAFCLLGCSWLYGSSGSIIDARDPASPVRMRPDWRKLAGAEQTPNHNLQEVRGGWLLDSPSAGVFDDSFLSFGLIDARSPLSPETVARGRSTDDRYRFQSASWPRAGRDRFVLLTAAWAGEAIECREDNQGPLLTYDARRFRQTGAFRPIDAFRVRSGWYVDGNARATTALGCNTGGFDAHPRFRTGGLVVVGHADHGTRFVGVDSRGRMAEVGHFLPAVAQTAAAEWASSARNERYVFALEPSRGVDILRWTGPLDSTAG